MATTRKLGFMKFDPTVNSGQIVQIVTVVAVAFGAWANVKSDLAVQKVEQEQTKRDIATQSQDVKAIAADVRELGRLVNDVRTDVAVLRGRTAERPVSTR